MINLRRLLFPAVVALSLLSFCPARLHAQTATKIFVASTGNDANDGSRGAPKRNFQAAHNAVAAGGQIVVLDTAGYGALAITKSLSITVPPGVNGFVTVTGNSNGITITAAAGDVVAVRGLVIEGGGTASGNSGVLVNSVGSLTVQDCTVRNFANGVNVLPGASTKLAVYHSDVRDCFYGVYVAAQGMAASVASVNGCRLQGNSVGLFAATQTSNGSVDASLADCVVVNNANGVEASGSGAVIRLNNCNLTGNNNGIFASNSGQILSRGNNTLEKNNANNTFPGAYSAK